MNMHAAGLLRRYTIPHLSARSLSTIFTVAGIALVVFVFAAALMLAEGLHRTLALTGHPDNLIVLRQGARNEIQSGMWRDAANVVLARPELERFPDGEPLASKDVLLLVNLTKRSDGLPSNVNFRGVSQRAPALRPEVVVVEGRFPAPGAREVIVARAIQRKFAGIDIGSSVRMVGVDWPVVGVFDAGTSAFNSEIWTDAEVLLPTIRRDQYSSITLRLRTAELFDSFRAEIENDRRLNLTVKREREFYAGQSEMLGLFITYLGTFVSVIFSVGAVIGALITMYAAVANRAREIGILRAIGFGRSAIMFAFLTESILLALLGGIAGVLCALLLTGAQIATTNFQTFSEVAFTFAITPAIAGRAMLFAAIMGIAGGALPALRAARLRILEALR